MHVPLKFIFATALGVASIAGIYQSPTVAVQASAAKPSARIEAKTVSKPAKKADTKPSLPMCDCDKTGKCTCSAEACTCPNCPVHHKKAKAKKGTYTGNDGRVYSVNEKGQYFRRDCHGTYCEWVAVSPPGTKGAAPTPSYVRSTCGPGGCSSGTCSSGNCGGRRGRRR